MTAITMNFRIAFLHSGKVKVLYVTVATNTCEYMDWKCYNRASQKAETNMEDITVRCTLAIRQTEVDSSAAKLDVNRVKP